MALPDSIQSLTASFSFGILFEAASVAIFLFCSGHGLTILQDGRRLVLVLFLLFVALWAQIDFINLMLPKTSLTACQGLLIFSAVFDQLARVGMEQFILWSVGQGTKVTVERLILQGILVIRLVVGGVYVGFLRAEFAPTCIARSSLLPSSIIVLSFDIIIIGVLIIRAFSLGMFGDLRDKQSSARQEQSRAVIFTVAGFAVWTITSVVMLLGISRTPLILRTSLPSIGALILVGIVTIFSGALLSEREELLASGAQSPFVAPAPMARELPGSYIGDGSPMLGNMSTKNGRLFVVNPSPTPRESPTSYLQGNRQSDTKGFVKLEDEMVARALAERNHENFPANNGPGYRGSSGVFGAIFAAPLVGGNQVSLAPQIRPAAGNKPRDITMLAFNPLPTAQQNRSLFNWPKQPTKPTVRNLGISNPIIVDAEESAARPQGRIQTVDLATAAANERVRREAALARSRPLPQRPAPPLPLFSAQEGLHRSISTRRKEMPYLSKDKMPMIPDSTASILFFSPTNAKSTSASLSPAREEVRRRSPRNANSFDRMVNDEKTTPRSDLQRKGTIGLPSNPRSQGAAVPQGGNVPQQQTIMFMKNIVYDNPGMVETIIQDAPTMHQSVKRAKGLDQSSILSEASILKSSDSIIHRPRPYRKDSEKDRAIFPSESSPHHNRSKSGPSIMTRKSALAMYPGSPTLLPPLPPPPRSAKELRRLLPNDTKSMTFDEKIQLLFPAPPHSTLMRNRRSSVPSLPRVPSVFISETPLLRSPTDEMYQNKASKRTTIASFVTIEPTVCVGRPGDELLRSEEPPNYRFSANAYRNIADEVGESWIPGILSKESENRNVVQEHPKRQSVHNMRNSVLTEATSSAESVPDDATTYWGSVHSKIPLVDLREARRNARSTFILPNNSTRLGDALRPLPPLPPQVDYNDREETISTLLDTNEARGPKSSDSNDNRQSFFLDDGEALPGDKTPTSQTAPTWHRRIGDRLPTFSERQTKARMRKMPPPTPLLFNRNGRHAKVVTRAAEPSPVSSPERAVKEIQAQLRRFELNERTSSNLIIRYLPGSSSTSGDFSQKQAEDRLRLLENLEKEMGQQEDQWQQMQTSLDRDSISTTLSSIAIPLSPEPPARDGMSLEPPQRESRRQSRIAFRRARVRSSTSQTQGGNSSSTTSTQSSDTSRASIWQQRLAEAQMEYLENAPILLRKSMNFLSISNAPLGQLGSPTPPDSLDSGSEFEIGLEPDSDNEDSQAPKLFEVAHKEIPMLWQTPLPSPHAASGRMWNYSCESLKTSVVSLEPPAKKVRPSQPRFLQSMEITSSALWSKPSSSSERSRSIGLWRSKTVRSKSIVTRRASVKPQRKTRRVTCLPDIVESPVPVPHKRNTLGIFQFPWGEVSDQPVYQPPFNPTLLYRPIINLSLASKPQRLELEPQSGEYSSSFFDDYDEEEEGDEFDYDMSEEDDDEFDESTLFEIADLLKSNDVPTRESLLPSPRRIIDDYDDETDFESSSELDCETPVKVTLTPFQLPIQPLAMITRTSRLWKSELKASEPRAEGALPQPEASGWEALIPSADGSVRQNPRASENLPVLATQLLWDIDETEISLGISSVVWNNKENLTESSKPSFVSPKKPSTAMWAPRPEKMDPRKPGLFALDSGRSVFRTTDATPAAMNMVKVPRSRGSSLPVLSCQSLWSPKQGKNETTHWISKTIVELGTPVSGPATLMWAPVAKTTEYPTTGLFSNTTSRSDFRTTSQTPAAINMVYKSRSHQALLSQLTSANLWCEQKHIPSKHDWISESSTSPESLSVYSTPSSGPSSPASEVPSEASPNSSSVKTSSPKIPSLWGTITNTWWDSRSKKSPVPAPVTESTTEVKTSSSTAVLNVAVSPPNTPMMRRQKSRDVLATVRESRVLASRNMWEAKSLAHKNAPAKRFSRKSMAPEQPVLPKQKEFQHQHGVFNNRDRALAEAIAAGTTERKLVRTVATMTDWDAALVLAIAQSRPRMLRATATPDMWQVALVEAITKSNSTTTSSPYSFAARHSILFTESLVSSLSEICPAALRNVAITRPNREASSLWSASSKEATPKAELLWSKDTVPKHEVTSEVTKLGGEMIRKNPVTRTLHLPALESASFWKPTQSVNAERNWLSESPRIKVPKEIVNQTWVPRTDSSAVDNPCLWAPSKPLVAAPSSDIFAHVQVYQVKKASLRSATLPRLDSSDLYVPASQPKLATHWLHSTSMEFLAPPIKYNPSESELGSMTWTAPLASLLTAHESGRIWEPSPQSTTESEALFSNPHTEPWGRKKRAEEELDRIESSSLWWPSIGLTESPMNWLVVRRMTKVQFSY